MKFNKNHLGIALALTYIVMATLFILEFLLLMVAGDADLWGNPFSLWQALVFLLIQVLIFYVGGWFFALIYNWLGK